MFCDHHLGLLVISRLMNDTLCVEKVQLLIMLAKTRIRQYNRRLNFWQKEAQDGATDAEPRPRI